MHRDRNKLFPTHHARPCRWMTDGCTGAGRCRATACRCNCGSTTRAGTYPLIFQSRASFSAVPEAHAFRESRRDGDSRSPLMARVLRRRRSFPTLTTSIFFLIQISFIEFGRPAILPRCARHEKVRVRATRDRATRSWTGMANYGGGKFSRVVPAPSLPFSFSHPFERKCANSVTKS